MSILLIMKMFVLALPLLATIGGFVLALLEKDSSVFVMVLLMTIMFEPILAAICLAK